MGTILAQESSAPSIESICNKIIRRMEAGKLKQDAALLAGKIDIQKYLSNQIDVVAYYFLFLVPWAIKVESYCELVEEWIDSDLRPLVVKTRFPLIKFTGITKSRMCHWSAMAIERELKFEKNESGLAGDSQSSSEINSHTPASGRQKIKSMLDEKGWTSYQWAQAASEISNNGVVDPGTPRRWINGTTKTIREPGATLLAQVLGLEKLPD